MNKLVADSSISESLKLDPSAPDIVSDSSESSSYREVVNASSIVGGAQVINMIISLIRTKLVALLIGPTGIGIVGLYHRNPVWIGN